MTNYIAENRANWDARAAAHAAAPDYCVEKLIADPTFISKVVRFDRALLGDIAGVRGLHLQCHIGTDTISLARLGGIMTGLDFSPASLAYARDIACRAAVPVQFVEAEVYEAASVLGHGNFDLVYTGIGALHYLPSISTWADTVADLLAPGGRLFIREQHPLVSALADPMPAGQLVIDQTYYERPEPSTWIISGTYVETDAKIERMPVHLWNHGLGEVVMAAIASGLLITALVEHDSVPFEALPGEMERVGDSDEWRLRDRPWRMPMTYTLSAIKPAP